MSPEWVAAITVIVVNLFTAGVVYGSLQSQTKANTKSIDALNVEQDRQWQAINETTEHVAYLRGRQGVNGLAKGAGGSH